MKPSSLRLSIWINSRTSRSKTFSSSEIPTRVAKNELLYQYTVIDPLVYAGPWLAEFSLYPQTRPMFEFACHEGNHSLPNILRAERLKEGRSLESLGGQ